LNFFKSVDLQKLTEINRLLSINFAVNQKNTNTQNSNTGRCYLSQRRKLKQNRKSDDDDDAVHKLCIVKAHKVQTVKLTLYKH